MIPFPHIYFILLSILMSGSDSSDSSDEGEYSMKNINPLLCESNRAIDTMIHFTRWQLKTETQRLDNMLKAAEEQKKIVETLRETQELLKKRLTG